MRNIHAFRVEVATQPRRSRSLDEQLFVRLPGLFAALSALVMRLPPGSGLKCALLARSAATSFAAFNRRDFDVVLVQFARDIEYEPPAEAQALGASETIRGREELAAAYAEIFDDWARWEMIPAWMLDRGDALAVLSAGHGHGRESGMSLRTEWASVYRMRRGRVTRQRDFLSWEEALRELEVDPAALPAGLLGAGG